MGKKNKKIKKVPTGQIFRSLYGEINGVDDLSEVLLTVERQTIDAPTLSIPTKPDPAWSETDAAGHYHAFNLDPFGDEGELLPTLVRRNSETSEDTESDWDAPVSYWYECKICSERIIPRFVPNRDPALQTIPGPVFWRVEVEAVGPGANRLDKINVVSVSFRCRDETIGLEQFGIGVLYNKAIEMTNSGYVKWTGYIIGTSTLGQRKIT